MSDQNNVMRDRDAGMTQKGDAASDAASVQGAAEQDAGRKLLNSGWDPAEAARLRWSKERERKAAGEAPDAAPADHVLRWSGSLRVGEITAALERKARNGDSHAARELRAWLAEYPPTDEAIDLADIPAAMRQRLLKRLLAEIEEEDAANGHIREGM
jgi:phage antirepressor YoqD-like protein